MARRIWQEEKYKKNISRFLSFGDHNKNCILGMIYFEIPWTDRKDQNNIRTRKKCYSRDVHSGSISCWTRMAWTEINTKKTDWERKKLLLGIRTFSRFVSQKKPFSRRSVTYTRTREAKWVEQQRKTVHEEENREKSKLLSLVETVIMQQDKHQGAPLADARHECDGSWSGRSGVGLSHTNMWASEQVLQASKFGAEHC